MPPKEKYSADRPNIVLILADDMGFSDLGCYGSEIRTPNLDRLAEEGIRFTQAYNCARCCPTRASLLTGLYPHQAGIGHMTSNQGVPAYQGYLRDDCVTAAEVLRAGGYRTLMSGKWHVCGGFPRNDPSRWYAGDPDRPLPPDRGFDEWYGTPAGAGSYFNPKPLFRNYSVIEPDAENYYYTDAVTDHAVRMVEKAGGEKQPFFLYVAYTAPHWPLHAPEEEIESYLGRYRKGWDSVRTARHEELKGLGLLNPKWDISPRDEQAPEWNAIKLKEWEDRRMAVYAAQIARMDHGIGRITTKLKEQGIEKDTLLLFLADNGGCAEFLKEDTQKDREWPTTVDGRPVRFGNLPEVPPGGPMSYQSYELPWANVSNTPFRLFKHWVHEGGISTPLIVHRPGMIPAGTINHEPLHVADFLPTFLEAAELKHPAEFNGRFVQPLEGVSFLPALRGEPWRRGRPIFFEHEGNRAVRDGRWKLVSRRPGHFELYDMMEDRTELRDLAEKDKPRVEKMQVLYHEFAGRCGVLPWERVCALGRKK